MAAQVVAAAASAAQELIDGIHFAPGEDGNSAFNLDDLELTDSLFEARNTYHSPKELSAALAKLGKQTPDIQRKFWSELCSEGASGSPPRQLAAYLSFLVASEKRSADKVIAACAYLQLVQLDGSAAYGILKASFMLRIVSTLSVVVGSAFRKQARDENSKQSEEDTGDEEPEQRPTTDSELGTHFKNALVQLSGVASHKLMQHQHDVVERCIDLCILALCLLTVAPNGQKPAGAQESAAQAIVQIAQSSAFAYTCTFRSAFPLLTMKVRDPRLPDAPKSRVQFHKAILAVLVAILEMRECPADAELPAHVETPQGSAVETEDRSSDDDSVDEDSDEGVAASVSHNADTAQARNFSLNISCVLGLTQRLCMQAPEKADYRTTVASSVVTLLAFLNEEACSLFLRLLTHLAKSSKVAQRVFAVDLAGKLLLSPGGVVERAGSMGWLFGVILGRCSDKTPNVRTRAISILHDMLCAAVGKAVSPTVVQLLRQSSLGISAQELAGDAETPMNVSSAEDNDEADAPTASRAHERKPEVYDLIEIIRDRVTDDKATVRRTAILAFEMVLTLPHENEGGTGQELLITDDDVSLLMERCGDVSLATRRQAMISLSNLVKLRPGDAALQDAWVQAVLPMVSDPESGVQQKLASIVKELLYDAVVEWNGKKGRTDSQSLAVWNLASRIIATDKSKLLHSCVTTMLRQGLVTNMKTLLTALRNVCTLESRDSSDDTSMASWQNDPDSIAPAGWLLLEALMVQSTEGSSATGLSAATVSSLRGQTSFVLSCWRNRKCASEQDSVDEEACRMLRVVTCMAPSMAKADVQVFSDDLLKIVSSMHCAPNALTTAIRCLKEITIALSGDAQDANMKITEWSNELLQLTFSVMYSYVWHDLPQDGIRFPGELEARAVMRVPQRGVTVSAVQRAMCIVGEISMLGFSVEEDAGVHLKRDKMDRLRIPIPQELVSLMKVLMAAELPSGSDAAAGTGSRNTPLAVRAHAFVAMGKVCMRDSTLAKDMVNVFVRELMKTDSPITASMSALTLNTFQDPEHGSESIVRSNALLVLGDLCIRYTNLVDRHVGSMAACLQDSDPLVRKHAFVLLTQLLLQDYVKWRGLLLHRFLVLAVDDDAEVSQVAEHVLCVTLLQKYPTLFASHFVECIIVLNNFSEHPTYQAAAAQGAEGSGAAVTMEGVQMVGASKRKLRLKIYAMMLESFSDEQKISVTAKLNQEILAFGVDNLSLTEATREKVEDIIRDALLVLRSPLLKVTGKGKSGDSEAEMDEEAANIVASVASAKGRVLAKVSRQHLAEQLLPTVLSLKHTLEGCKSSLQRDLMSYLVYVNHNYKEEMSQVLSSDPVLKQEIEYDMKQFEQNKRAAARKAGVARGTPCSKAFPSVTPYTTRRASSQDDGARTAVSACKLASASRQGAAGRTPSQALREVRRQSVQRSVSKPSADTEQDNENDDGNTHCPPTTPRQRRWSVTFVRKESAQSTPTTESPTPLKQASKRGRSSIQSPDSNEPGVDYPESPATPIAKPAKKARGKRKSVLAAR